MNICYNKCIQIIENLQWTTHIFNLAKIADSVSYEEISDIAQKNEEDSTYPDSTVNYWVWCSIMGPLAGLHGYLSTYLKELSSEVHNRRLQIKRMMLNNLVMQTSRQDALVKNIFV